MAHIRGDCMLGRNCRKLWDIGGIMAHIRGCRKLRDVGRSDGTYQRGLYAEGSECFGEATESFGSNGEELANIRQDCKANCRKLRRMSGEKHQKGIRFNGYIRVAGDLGTGQKALKRLKVG